MNPLQTPNDPKLEALLDESLKPIDLPDGLTERILAQTTPLLEEPEVVGRIRPGLAWWRVARFAALITLVAGVGWAVFTTQNQSVSTSKQTQVATAPTEDVITDDAFAQVSFESGFVDQALDNRINTLRTQIELARAWRDDVAAGGNAESAVLQAEWQVLVDDTSRWF
ncbi:MAG: hypothetical protein RIG82_06090 [Phycisphaeraceae bacterium]